MRSTAKAVMMKKESSERLKEPTDDIGLLLHILTEYKETEQLEKLLLVVNTYKANPRISAKEIYRSLEDKKNNSTFTHKAY